MMRFLRFCFWVFARIVLALRYRVRVHGLEKVRELKGPILILPNHPAFIDPPIVVTWLYPDLKPRPLLLEENFTGILRPLMSLLDAVRVPDLSEASAEARARAQEAIQGVIEALKAGRNVILWPSGRLQRNGCERIAAARTLSDVLQAVPEAQIVVLRTRGLWGSRFSVGWNATVPPFGKRLIQGAGLLLANLLFFAPRRQVTLTLEPIDRSRLPGLAREVLNPWLESVYNADGPEKPTFVPGHFLFGPRTREFPVYQVAVDIDQGEIKPETRAAVTEMVEEKINRPLAASETAPEIHLDTLGLDSIARTELSLKVERRFGFSGDGVPETMGQLYALASGLVKRQPPKPPPPQWFTPVRDEPMRIQGETIAEAFVERALATPKEVACVDDLSGPMTYERLLTGALIMARRFRALPQPNVGLVLPASVACDLALLGLYLAGKLPVVLNFTTGPANLEHACKLMSLGHVVTSRAFLDRRDLKMPVPTILLEEMRKSTGKFEKLRTLLQVKWFGGSIRRSVPRPDPDSHAVVLFTSGSEKAPKAVPLTHRNILTNQRSGIEALKVTRQDSMLGFLPAFHSFGLSITGLFPLLAGMKVVRHPDPTDAGALARKIGLYKPTILVGTPTFISYVVERAQPGELASLRMIIIGAEKCPQALFDRLKESAPKAQVLEGYGITECAPVVSVNTAADCRPGTVGKPMPGVEVRVVDLETGERVGAGQRGMLLVSGATIFPGYLGHEGASPFRHLEGKRWYVTGDLVEIDSDGFIHFAGRLKRFLKAGGEMISLPALEEPFARRYPPTNNGSGEVVRVAVEGIEIDGGGRRIVLFSTEPITLREANEILNQEGFHGVMHLDEVRQVEKIPVLGTGKTDYKVLRAQLLSGERDAG